MKRLICAIIAIAALTLSLASCNLDRKLEGVELKFQQTISGATEYSFNAELKTDIDGSKSEMYVKCYKKNGEYAYVFTSPDDDGKEYRRLYADGKLYEFLSGKQTTLLGEIEGGTYYEQETSLSDSKNFLYQIEQNIMMATYATILLNGEKETLDGKEVYRYDIPVDNNTYSLWYDDAYLVKIRAVIKTDNGDGTTKSDTYEAKFSDYNFSDVDADTFKRPSDMGATYVESPTSIENLGILGDFSGMSANWMK